MVRKLVPPHHEPEMGLRVRAATALDGEFVRALSAEVFQQFGDYGSFLLGYLTHPSVFTSISEEGGERLGFVMLALVLSDEPSLIGSPLASEPPDERWLDAEIIAIAVAPAHQARGVGRRLILHAIDCAQGWRRTANVRSLQLNVADSNQRAFAFFERHGFRVLCANDGAYPRGQRSIRMIRPLEGA